MTVPQWKKRVEEILGTTDVHYGWVSKEPKYIGRGVTHLVNGDLDKATAALTAPVVELLRGLKKNGAVIHDCGRRVDGVIHNTAIDDLIKELGGE